MSDSDFSDEETPVAVSFKNSKDEVQNFEKNVTSFLKEQREALKEKRRKTNETLKTQSAKKPKQSQTDTLVEPPKLDADDPELESKMLPASVLAAISETTKDKSTTEKPDTSDDEVAEEQNAAANSKRITFTRTGKKEYKGLNIHVESLLHVTQQRVDNALEFRNKRFSKGHRESVKVNLVHQKKLAASGQDLPKPKNYL